MAKHRISILWMVLACAISTYFPASAPAEAPRQRPNILFILCDDHAYQAISAYGSGLNQTPNIDRLADEGMRFDRCWVTNSLCGPSRACILTGKYSNLNGFFNNTNSVFDGSQQTFPKLLRAAGYVTAIEGKWHLVSNPTGFDYWEILPGQGQYYNPPMIRMVQHVKYTGYTTDILTDHALEWLKNRDKSKPFLLMFHNKAPHRPWEPSLENLTQYDGVKFPEPPTLFDDYSGRGKAEHDQVMTILHYMNADDLKLKTPKDLNPDQAKIWNAYYAPRNEPFERAHLEGADLLRWKYQRFMHDYMATISSVDQSTGKLLNYLKESGLDQNTVVVYTSDQGFFLGEHGWFDKRWIFTESLKTPLLVRWPGVIKPGSVKTDIVSNLDFAETFLDMAGAPIPSDMQGKSLVPILKGQTPPDWRTAFYYHYYEHPGPHNVARQYGIVTDRYTLVYFYEPDMNYWELFDLQTDPHQMKSVYGQPQYAQTQAQLMQQLTQLRAEYHEPPQDSPKSAIKRWKIGPPVN